MIGAIQEFLFVEIRLDDQVVGYGDVVPQIVRDATDVRREGESDIPMFDEEPVVILAVVGDGEGCDGEVADH